MVERGPNPNAHSGIDDAAPRVRSSCLSDAPYWLKAREPFACLLFLLPLLLIYEAGMLLAEHSSGSRAARNGADYWMRSWLEHAGINSLIVLPLLIVGVLLLWHRYGDYPWRISRETLVGMFAESLLLAVCLLFVAQVQDMAFHCLFPADVSVHETYPAQRLLLSLPNGLTQRLISYVGAGVYEETLFRLTLLPSCLAVLKSLHMPSTWAAVLAVFLTSLTFSVAHYVGAAGEPFSLFTFTFRTTAGCFFATVFLLRGFGITVGCHALYDVLVGILTMSASDAV